MRVMAEGAEKQREQLRVEYERQIQDINTRLETERGLTETQVAELLNQQLLFATTIRKEFGRIERPNYNRPNASRRRPDAITIRRRP